MPQPSTPKSIDQLRADYEQLRDRKIKVDTQLGAARQQLEQLKAAAREKFQTDDLDELKQQLNQIRAENEQRRQEYQSSLELIESRLADVEQEFQASEESR